MDGERRAEHAAQEHGEGGQYGGAQAGGQVGKPLLYQ